MIQKYLQARSIVLESGRGGHTHQKILTSLKKERKKGTSSQNHQTPNPWEKGGGGSATSLIYDCRNIVKNMAETDTWGNLSYEKVQDLCFSISLTVFSPLMFL